MQKWKDKKMFEAVICFDELCLFELSESSKPNCSWHPEGSCAFQRKAFMPLILSGSLIGIDSYEVCEVGLG